MALTLSRDDTHTGLQEHMDEELDRQTSYSGISIKSSNAHLGDSYHIEHHHYYNLPVERSRKGKSRATYIRNPEAPEEDEEHMELLAPVEEQEGWVTTLQDLPCKAFVRLQDKERDDKSNTDKDPACNVRIEVMGHDIITNSRRNLTIDWRDPHREAEHFWMPGTLMKVARTEAEVVVEFSDCIQKTNATRDYVNNYTAAYRPATPNVNITFECPDESVAEELQARFLHYNGPSAPGNRNETSFTQHCIVRHDSIKAIDGKILGRGLYVWTHILDSDTGLQSKVLDFGCFTSQLDFEVEIFDNTFFLYIRHFMKIQYNPIDVGKNAYWPPRKVEDNRSGAPKSMEIGLDGKDNTLVMKSPLDKSVALLNGTLGHECGVIAKAWFDLEYVDRFRRVARKRTEQGQLTLWDKEGYLYGLIRKIGKDDKNRNNSNTDLKKVKSGSGNDDSDDDDQVSQQLWRALRWKPDKSRPKARFDGDNKVTMEDVESKTGDYLSRGDQTTVLEPRTRGSSSPTNWSKTKIELRFGSREDIDRFAVVIRQYDVK